MTREKALALMDRLSIAGYRARVLAIPADARFMRADGDADGRNYHVDIVELGVDKVDLRALVEIADELEVDVGSNSMGGNTTISFSSLSTRPEVVQAPRRHPKP